jgi:uncharacterized protein (TIRG00374 family)
MTAEPLGGALPSGNQSRRPAGFFARNARWIRTAVTIGAFSAIFLLIDPRDILKAFTGVVWGWVLARIGPFALSVLIQAWRWRVFLRLEGIEVGTWLVFRRTWTARFFAYALPGSLGNDAFRIIESGDFADSRQAVARSVLLDRVIGMLGLMLYVSFAGLVWSMAVPQWPLAWLSGAGVLGALAALGWLARRASSRMAAALARRVPGERVRSFAESLADSLTVLQEHRGALVSATVATLAFNLVTASGSWLGFQALGVQIGLAVVLAIMPIVHLMSMLPISVNGLGLREGVFILLFAAAGVPAAPAAAVAILLNVTGTLMSMLGGVLYLAERRRIAAPAR